MSRSVAFALVIAALVFSSRGAHAGCNSFPAASAVSSSVAAGSPTVSYKMALGRLNQPYAMPGVSDGIMLTPDGICVDPAGSELTFPTAAEDPLVVAMLRLAEAPLVFPLVLASSEARCGEIRDSMNAKFDTGWDCRPHTVSVVAIEGGPNAIRFSLADLPARLLAGDPSSIELASGVLKMFATDRADGVAPIASALVNKDCGSLCSTLAANGALGCTDQAYVKNVLDAFTPWKLLCGVQQLPTTLATTDFSDQCTADPDNPIGLPGCDEHADTLKIYVDECGNLHLPFKWDGLLSSSVSTRLVSGTSAVSRHVEAHDKRDVGVWVPGREFVGSTPLADAGGNSTDWRLPNVDVFWDKESQAFGLRGLVDKKEDSVIHVVSRLPVTVVCKDAPVEACMAVEEEYGVSKVTCACRDSRLADCGCKKEASPADANFFACEGAHDGMPCTRTRHCIPGGTCTGQPKCQDKFAVFSEKAPGSTSCWKDSDCPTDKQCGYSLFDFTNRMDSAATRTVTLDVDIKGTATRKRRGVCQKSAGEVCVPSTVSNCNGGANDFCEGYTLMGHGKN